MMSNFPEIGYTPANLRFLIESKAGLKRKAAFALLSVADNTIRQWLIPVDLKATEIWKTWFKLLEIKEPA